jgi:hypothetical protein
MTRLKPIVIRAAVALVLMAPVTAVTNSLDFGAKPAVAKAEGKKKSFFDHRCLGIKPPAP